MALRHADVFQQGLHVLGHEGCPHPRTVVAIVADGHLDHGMFDVAFGSATRPAEVIPRPVESVPKKVDKQTHAAKSWGGQEMSCCPSCAGLVHGEPRQWCLVSAWLFVGQF
jgi:hypothetical protein